MNVDGKHYRTIWIHPEHSGIIQIIDQTKLPFQFKVVNLDTLASAEAAIVDMQVRGAGLIGATAAFGMYLAAVHSDEKNFKTELIEAGKRLINTRPTAVNLEWAVQKQLMQISNCKSREACIETTLITAKAIAEEDADMCKSIGVHGARLIEKIHSEKNGDVVNVLTHCNAGWLAFVDYGSATAPIYQAHDSGIKVHVWVDETRPRNQGGRLTAWELSQHGVPHTVIPDNTGGHLMQHGLVDLVITGADRVTKTGDAANKVGTYLKALAAKDNKVPFYVALPSSTFDWDISDGAKEIPIEQRDGSEVRRMSGLYKNEEIEVMILPETSRVANYGFDVTPSRLISGLITEKGVCRANESEIRKLFN
ncbi:MAG: S-methyl-5-thioribose-1-phosphate isomerase [Cytophagales bacterium]|nr:S-methyl-5-thioribose-1-phosphate isomerase [Cytophagales bacterium]